MLKKNPRNYGQSARNFWTGTFGTDEDHDVGSWCNLRVYTCKHAIYFYNHFTRDSTCFLPHKSLQSNEVCKPLCEIYDVILQKPV